MPGSKISTVDSAMIKEIPPDLMTPAAAIAAYPLWEYETILLARESDLNAYGAKGWELISVTSQPGDMAMFYFRRPKG